jgi:methyl-accepting chemotaxis protein
MIAQVCGIAPLLGAVAGVLLVSERAGQGDTSVLGLGAVILGYVFVLFSFVLPDKALAAAALELAEPVATEQTKTEGELITRIHVTSDGLVRATRAINEATIMQAEGAHEQVDMIQTTNEMMRQFLALSEQINDQSRSMAERAQTATELSQSGQSSIEEAIRGMEEIRTQVLTIVETIASLAALTRRVDEIISSVSEIATQSTLLSLNASIEAARAGVHGRGFAVVADEVRELAQQSTQSAEQVRDILDEIQVAMRETIEATQIGMQGVDAGMSLTEDANAVMRSLTENVVESQDAAQSIYAVIRKQTEGLEEIATNMERIDRITQQHLTSTRMVDTVSGNLSRMAAELKSALQLGTALDPDAVPEKGGKSAPPPVR